MAPSMSSPAVTDTHVVSGCRILGEYGADRTTFHAETITHVAERELGYVVISVVATSSSGRRGSASRQSEDAVPAPTAAFQQAVAVLTQEAVAWDAAQPARN